MDSLKNKKLLVYIVMGILSLIGIYSEFAFCLVDYSFQSVIELIATCIICALVFYYAVSNFKVPHGNLLRYLFLAFSIMCLFGLLYVDTSGAGTPKSIYIFQVLRGFVVIISTFIAGRLDRIKQNTVLVIINAILLLATSIENIIVGNVSNFIDIVFFSNFFILWIDLAIAYVFRYYGHKEAGLEDK